LFNAKGAILQLYHSHSMI